RFVVLELPQRIYDGIECFPGARSSPCPAIDNQSIRRLRDLRIEVVHQHAHRSFLVPAFAAAHCATRGADESLSTHKLSRPLSNSPARMAEATCAISLASGRSCKSGAAYFRTTA